MEINVKFFCDLLWSENQKQNLISRKMSRKDLEQHIEDSLILADYFDLSKLNIIDIGSGAGFPGLILATVFVNARFTLVEADLKKSRFLLHAVEKLALKNVEVVRERIETLARDKAYREKFDFCTSRAVAAMNVMLEYGMPMLKMKGRLCLWKGKNFELEIEESQNALKILHASIEKIFPYELVNDRQRVLILIRKEGVCPPRYPRRVGIPLKRPL